MIRANRDGSWEAKKALLHRMFSVSAPTTRDIPCETSEFTPVRASGIMRRKRAIAVCNRSQSASPPPDAAQESFIDIRYIRNDGR
jgi:hypothetical protein